MRGRIRFGAGLGESYGPHPAHRKPVLDTTFRCPPDVSGQPERIAPAGRRTQSKMTQAEFGSMSVDELWALHSKVSLILARKMREEKARLESRLRQLDRGVEVKEDSARRPYPKVLPKYRNPAQPTQTWAGRGKTPRWLSAQLKSGKKLDDFRIPSTPGRGRRTVTR